MDRAPIASASAALQAFANVVLGNDGRLLLEVGVPTGVVGVIVGVDDETHRLVGDAFQRVLNLVGQRGVLVIDDDDAVVADRRANVSARALQHVNIASHSRDLHLHFAEVLFLSGSQGTGEQTGGKKGRHFTHDRPRFSV